ncbi:hypothetical protein ACTFIU_010182 [Dictyostelium citrinum]
MSKKCTIIYATESGTSQEVAEKLSRDLVSYEIKPRLVDVANYNKLELPMEKIVIFVLSTTGHGEVPDPMKPLWNFLLIKSLPSNSLANTKFAILGLGDSSYTTYNFAAKKLYQRLQSLGGTPLLRRGDADDQHDLGIDYEVEKWSQELISKLLTIYPLSPNFNIDNIKNQLNKSKYNIKIDKINENNKEIKYEIPSQFYKSKLKVNKRITAQEWEQDVRHIELDIGECKEVQPPIKYQSGDVAYVLPKNPIKRVNEFIELLGLHSNWIIESIEPIDREITQSPTLLKLPITVYDLVRCYFDIMGSPRRYFFQLLSHFVTNPMEKERLEFFSSTEGQDDLRTYNQKEKRNYIDVLKEFPSIEIPFEYLFDLIPPIKPRPFSISSSSLLNPNTIHLTVGINTYTTPFRRLFRTGLCSQYFTSLNDNNNNNNNNNNDKDKDNNYIVPIFIKESGARLPKSNETPIIMVGPGTGCAIFRSFMQERFYFKNNNGNDGGDDDNSKLGDALFYFGCRSESKDYYYRDEFESNLEKGVISKLSVAFSRDGKDGKKVYVQQYIENDSDLIWDIINNRNGFFYISGSSGRMPKDVKQSLLTIIKSNLLKNNDNNNQNNIDEIVNSYFEKLEVEKRFITETW